ncbi:exo-alpha-sialidase [candidate division WOR-3 bacterium]|nr:exo-alpha-sialidase [candidate division WOR-3 bacterium]
MKRFGTYCIFLCIGLFPITLHSWTIPINISNTPDGRSRYPAIAVNKYNRVYVVWSDDYQTDWHRNNIYSCYSDDGTTWSEPILISGDSTDWLSISDAACDIFGNPHVVWDDWVGSIDIYYSKWENGSWTPEMNLSNSPDKRSQTVNIVIDSKNIIHVVWQEGTYLGYGDIVHRYYDRAFWSDTINISHNPQPSGNPAIAIDLEDCIHVVWGDSDEDGGGIFYSKFDGISWSEPSRVPDTENGCDASVVADSLGYPHVAWTEILAPQDEEIY